MGNRVPGAAGRHDNGLNLLRLIFASLVIVGHTPEMMDGNQLRDPLARAFGTIGFGALAVDCFFVISGYLIVASFLGSQSTISYLRKRVFRIYPGFIAASLISLIVFAPLAGADIVDVIRRLPASALDIVLLQPVNASVFDGSPYPYLNASLWTISYEFRCYLLVVIFGWSTILRRPRLLALIAIAGLFVFVSEPFGVWSTDNMPFPFSRVLVGRLGDSIRLTSLFLTGSLFFLFRDRIPFNIRWTVSAIIGLATGLRFAPLAEPAVAIFGGYLIFAFSAAAAGTFVSTIRNDISYGIYLYGWPIGALIVWRFAELPLALAIAATLVIAVGFGWTSWLWIERPVMRRMTKRAEHVDAPIVEFATS